MATATAPLLNRKEAGIILGVSLRTVDELIATGNLPVVRFGKKCVKIRPSALDYLIEARNAYQTRRRKGHSHDERRPRK